LECGGSTPLFFHHSKTANDSVNPSIERKAASSNAAGEFKFVRKRWFIPHFTLLIPNSEAERKSLLFLNVKCEVGSVE